MPTDSISISLEIIPLFLEFFECYEKWFKFFCHPEYNARTFKITCDGYSNIYPFCS